VAVLEIDGDRGVKVKASVVYPDESRRRVYVLWHDEKLRRHPATIRVDFRSGWHGTACMSAPNWPRSRRSTARLSN
jgi:hypothetical protein